MHTRGCSLRFFGGPSLALAGLILTGVQEKRYNPYYTLLLNHLCTNSHSHRFTFQYALWDFLRTLGDGDLGKEGKGRAENLAKTLAYMIGRHTLDLTVLKVWCR